jgi:copper chaperone CopZ
MNENIKTMKLKVEGIECRGCVEDYEKVLAEKDGIVDVLYDFNESVITLKYDDSVIDRRQVYVHVRRLARSAKPLS